MTKAWDEDQKLQMTEAIFELMANGKSLRKSCEQMGLEATTVLRWIDASESLKLQYAHARAQLIDAQAEELEEIGEQAAMAETAVQVNGLRLKSDNRKWLLSRLAPKKYGDKLAIGGAEDMPSIKTVSRIEIVSL